MALQAKATKELLIVEVNRLTLLTEALLAFAQGDDDALNRLASTPAPTAPAPQPTFKPETSIHLIPKTTDGECHCKMAVKDKHSATHLCLLCSGNAYKNYYVFSHTPEGQAMLRGEATPIDEFRVPDTIDAGPLASTVESAPLQVVTVDVVFPAGVWLPPPDFSTLPVSDEDDDNGEEN